MMTDAPNESDSSTRARAIETSSLPAPLIESDVDLRSLPYLPIDVAALRERELFENPQPAAFRATLLLWCAAWHQVPAGSVPNNERWLAMHADSQGMWDEIRERVLAAWIPCSDGRLYHPELVGRALEAMEERRVRRARTKAATEARSRKRREREDARDGDRDDSIDAKRVEFRAEDRDVTELRGENGGQDESSVLDAHDDSWWTDNARVMSLGQELGVVPHENGEELAVYRDRVRQAWLTRRRATA